MIGDLAGAKDSATLARLKPPPHACDCHMHFYGPVARYALAPTAPYPPPLATAAMYRREIFERLGIERVVAVQPAAYGTDHTCMLDAMAELGDAARGIAVVTPATSEAEVAELYRRGVRGARFFLMRNAIVTWDMLEPVAARIAPLGWHIQLQIDGRELPDHAARLAKLPCRLVIDHNGKFVEPVAPGHPALSTLLSLLESGRIWVKASAPYETSKAGPPRYGDVGTIAKTLIKAAPERVVWASNWPHGGFAGHKPDDANLLDLLLDWAPDDEVRRRILVDNPAELYGF